MSPIDAEITDGIKVFGLWKPCFGVSGFLRVWRGVSRALLGHGQQPLAIEIIATGIPEIESCRSFLTESFKRLVRIKFDWFGIGLTFRVRRFARNWEQGANRESNKSGSIVSKGPLGRIQSSQD